MANKEKSKEIGVIGMTYENRKSKKRGVLESRDDKYMTLMMRDEDGKQFNITYGTFSSSWRQYKGDDVIETSTQVELNREEDETVAETPAKKDADEKKVEEAVKKASKDPHANMKMHQHIKHVVEEILEKRGITSIRAVAGSKGSISMCVGNRHFVELWPKSHKGSFQLCLKEEFFKFAENFFTEEAITTAEYKETWKLKYNVQYIPVERLEYVVTDLVKNLDRFVTENTETEKKTTVEQEEK